MSVDACFLFPVGDGHRLWVETRGNPAGEPVLVLHGGPGSGCSPRFLELYDGARQFLVLPDQRGAGRSEPAGERAANTTAHLIADLEALRLHLGIARWRVTGGSMGMAGATAAAAPEGEALDRLVLKYRLQAHYLQSECFLGEAAFFAACTHLAGVPVALIHGREDRVCPPDGAEAVHAALPGSRLMWVQGCGHDPFHPAMLAAWRVALSGLPPPA